MQIDDDELIIKLTNEVLDENLDMVEQFKEGKDYLINFFVGKLMKKTNGQVNPKKAIEIINKEINRR